jgi:diadenosine tetraphosphatase ApaH/serine/threonine PP2A family protein phosphatase
MRALIVSDIHGNSHALDAVLAAAPAFDELWNLGDMVGYGARPNEVLRTLHAVQAVKKLDVRGNHDRVCAGLSSALGFNPVAAEAVVWTRANLTPENMAWLREVPKGPIRASARAMCAHGSPLHEDQYITSMRDAWTPLQRMETEITFFGHTHIQGGFSQNGEDWEEDRPMYKGLNETEQFVLDVPVGTRHLINPGSVGQPRDGDWHAAFAMYDDVLEQVTFFRTPYDVEAAQAAIRAAKLPERLASRLATGK